MMQWNRISEDRLNIKASKLDMVYWQRLLSANRQLHNTFPDRVSRHIGMDMFGSLYNLEP